MRKSERNEREIKRRMIAGYEKERNKLVEGKE